MGIRRVGDPVLAAVQDIAVVLLFRPQLHADHIAARAFLGHGKRAHGLARTQVGQILAALFVRAVQLDLVHAQVRMRAIGQADGCAGPRDFLDRDDMGQIAHARAAKFLGDGDAQQPQVTHLGPKVVRKGVGLVDLGRDGLDAVLRPAMHHVAQGVHILAQIEFHPSREHPRSPHPRFIERPFISGITRPAPFRQGKACAGTHDRSTPALTRFQSP